MHGGKAASETSKQRPEGKVKEAARTRGTGAGLQAETSGGSVPPAGDVADTEDRTADDNRVTRVKASG